MARGASIFVLVSCRCYNDQSKRIRRPYEINIYSSSAVGSDIRVWSSRQCCDCSGCQPQLNTSYKNLNQRCFEGTTRATGGAPFDLAVRCGRKRGHGVVIIIVYTCCRKHWWGSCSCEVKGAVIPPLRHPGSSSKYIFATHTRNIKATAYSRRTIFGYMNHNQPIEMYQTFAQLWATAMSHSLPISGTLPFPKW